MFDDEEEQSYESAGVTSSFSSPDKLEADIDKNVCPQKL
jgi:hypothetical protein